MVFRKVEVHADGRRKMGRQGDLVGRTLDDVMQVGLGQRKLQHRHTDIAAHGHIHTKHLECMGSQRRGRRFAIGAGDCQALGPVGSAAARSWKNRSTSPVIGTPASLAL
jgi:hypothetical protein